MSGAPKDLEAAVVEIIHLLYNDERIAARDLLADMAEKHQHLGIASAAISWAGYIAMQMNGRTPGVWALEVEGPRPIAPGDEEFYALTAMRVVACMANDDRDVAFELLWALDPLDLMKAAWTLADLVCIEAKR